MHAAPRHFFPGLGAQQLCSLHDLTELPLHASQVYVQQGLNEEFGPPVWYATNRGAGELKLLANYSQAFSWEVRHNVDDDGSQKAEFWPLPQNMLDTGFSADTVFDRALYGKQESHGRLFT